MRLVFIYGLPATGKLTVARELAKLVDYKLFHNHLVVDLLLSTFEFGSAPFVELREQIWLSVFDQACRSQLKGLIFTFNPETTVRADFVQKTLEVVGKSGGQVDFVELVCPLDELRRRIDSPSRLQYRKLSSLLLFEQLEASGEFGQVAYAEIWCHGQYKSQKSPGSRGGDRACSPPRLTSPVLLPL